MAPGLGIKGLRDTSVVGEILNKWDVRQDV